MSGSGSDLDAARAEVAQRGLTGDAVAGLIPLVRTAPLEALGPVKQLLKRFFSSDPWTTDDDDALAGLLAGAEPTAGRQELDGDLVVVWGWHDGAFRLRVEQGGTGERSGGPDEAPAPAHRPDLEHTFAGAVVPEATPSPRTIRFATPSTRDGPARPFASAGAAASDPAAAALFDEFDDVTDVLVGPDFVAVTIARPDGWEALLAPMLDAVAEHYGDDGEPTARATAGSTAPVTRSLAVGATGEPAHAPRRLERAWAELGTLRADRGEDLDRVVAAAGDDEPARRQVAAALLADAPPDVAARNWERLLGDSSRSVRRSVVDAVADVEREELRPLLERALADADAWVRWKALHGIAAIGAGSSRDAVDARADDPDFRVRLEVARLRSG